VTIPGCDRYREPRPPWWWYLAVALVFAAIALIILYA